MLNRTHGMEVEQEEDISSALLQLSHKYRAVVVMGTGDSAVVHRPNETQAQAVDAFMTDYPLGRSPDDFPVRIELETKTAESLNRRCQALAKRLMSYLEHHGYKMEEAPVVIDQTRTRLGSGVFMDATHHSNFKKPHRASITILNAPPAYDSI